MRQAIDTPIRTASSWSYDEVNDVLYATIRDVDRSLGADEMESGAFVYVDEDEEPVGIVMPGFSRSPDRGGVLVDFDPPFYLELPPDKQRL